LPQPQLPLFVVLLSLVLSLLCAFIHTCIVGIFISLLLLVV
jgi:hypothetical protein